VGLCNSWTRSTPGFRFVRQNDYEVLIFNSRRAYGFAPASHYCIGEWWITSWFLYWTIDRENKPAPQSLGNSVRYLVRREFEFVCFHDSIIAKKIEHCNRLQYNGASISSRPLPAVLYNFCVIIKSTSPVHFGQGYLFNWQGPFNTLNR